MISRVLVDRGDDVTTVTLNRPEKRNALDGATWRALADVMDEIDQDDAVRCVVLAGAGDHFSGGADIGSFADERATAEQARKYGDVEMAGIYAVANCRHPVVASVSPRPSRSVGLLARLLLRRPSAGRSSTR